MIYDAQKVRLRIDSFQYDFYLLLKLRPLTGWGGGTENQRYKISELGQ